MNFSRILTLIIIFYVQNIFSQDLSESFLKENAQLIINESKTCVFTTIDKVGSPSSRIMDPFVPKNDFIVYLVTNPKSRKVTEIKLCFALLCFDLLCLALLGFASLKNKRPTAAKDTRPYGFCLLNFLDF